MKLNDTKYNVTIDLRWIIIWILICLGEPDILDSIIAVLQKLAN